MRDHSKMTLRRLRQNKLTRELCQEFRPHIEQLIQPIFVVQDIHDRQEISGLSGVYRDTPNTLLKQIEGDLENGIHKFLLFGVPSDKSRDHFHFDFLSEQITEIKKRFGKELWLSVDVCLCSSTEHGHCGILNASGDQVLNDLSVSALGQAALSYAEAGADCVAPSDMMDGRIAEIRQRFDQEKLQNTLIMSYAAKFHSKFYGPFREAADSAPKGEIPLKDRASYQIDPGSPKDALASAMRDYREGADILMVKPGLPYLDILQTLTKQIPCPWSVYEVSGEYAAIELLSREGLADGPAAHIEAWTALLRAGANTIISYGARQAKDWLNR